MCGIAGYFYTKPPNNSIDMNQLQMHRGPDSNGSMYFDNNKVGLFHQRLSIIDLSSAGKQPMTSSCDKCGIGIHLTYNGEIYNYRELKQRLIDRGHVFKSNSDSEVIIHLYAEYGLDAIKMLNGIFSFALYDNRDDEQEDGIQKGDLIIARDHLGVKPLYYAKSTSGVSFASELKTLLLDPNISRELDHQAIYSYMTFLWSPSPNTPLHHVKKLEPGHFFIVRNGTIIENKRFYEIPIEMNKLELSESDLIEQTREKIKQAVTKQMVADVPIGAFLSGGLDSSSIVAIMKEIEPDYEINCYSIGFKEYGDKSAEGFTSDLYYAKKVANRLGVKLHTLEIDSSIHNDLAEVIYHLDEPQADPAPINALKIAERANEHGLKVLMSGAGGDDIFTGYRRHYALMQEKYWSWLPKSMRKLIQIPAERQLQGRGFGSESAVIRRISKAFGYAGLPHEERLASYFYWSHPAIRRKILTPTTLAKISDTRGAQALHNTLANLPSNHAAIDKMLYLECKHFLTDHNLNYTDKMTMARSIETRVPLLDLNLVEWAFKLPNSLKQNKSTGKYIFKKSMESYLGKDIIYRKKTGFGAPLRKWIHKDLTDFIGEYLSEKSINERGLFNYNEIKTLIAADKCGKIDASYSIYSLLNIEMWCRIFIDQKIPGFATLS